MSDETPITGGLSIWIDQSHGSMLRVLSLVERRGWVVDSVDMPKANHPEGFRRLNLALSRREWFGGDLLTLARQIERLHCVKGCSESDEGLSAQKKTIVFPISAQSAIEARA